MSPAFAVWGPVDAYRDYPVCPSVPIGIPEQYGVPPRVLDYWRRKGWLGVPRPGRGSAVSWTDPVIAAQVDWLRRLAKSTRVLDDEDAAAGFYLRATGARYAVRVGGRPWRPLTDLNAAEMVTVTEAYTLAEVTR